MVGTADSVLIRDVSYIQRVLYREVPLYLTSAIYVCVALFCGTAIYACGLSAQSAAASVHVLRLFGSLPSVRLWCVCL